MEVINYSPVYYEKLLDFSKKTWPERPQEYLDYRLFKAPYNIEDNKCNLLVINDESNIVGCNMYFPTKARVCGKEENVFWSHDTFIDKECRGDAGMLLILESLRNKSTFGFGLTEMNQKIHEKLKINFVGYISHYIVVNIWAFKLIPEKLGLLPLKKPEKYRFPDEIKVGKNKFRLLHNPDELKIPENGYWNQEEIDIDFIRDEHFIRNRFFENFRGYYFYKLDMGVNHGADECYFVLRPTVEAGISVISVVDFRFNNKNKEQLRLIIKAVNKVAKANRTSLATFKVTMKSDRLMFNPLVYRRDTDTPISTHFNFGSEKKRIFVTSADSDTDFLKP
jgi:hypothetical protein